MIGTGNGVARARDVKRKPASGGRWNEEDFDKSRGVPWEPCTGEEGGFEVKLKVRLPADPETRKRVYEEKVPDKRRRFGDVRVCSRLPRVQGSEQRRDGDEPFGGVQTKGCRRIGGSC